MRPAAQQCQSSVTAEQKSKSDDYAERKHIYVTFMPHSQHNNSIKHIHSTSHVHTVTYFWEKQNIKWEIAEDRECEIC